MGYGCTTCIGNSGDLNEVVAEAITENGKFALCVQAVMGIDLCQVRKRRP